MKPTSTIEAHASPRPAKGASLTIVLPAWNEEDGIAEMVERIWKTEPALRDAGAYLEEVIVVDDGSTDTTADLLQKQNNVRLVRHPRNLGYGAALKTGFREARTELLAFLDADGTYPPEELPELCRRVCSGEADLAVGSRRAGFESRMPRTRKLGNLLWSSLVSTFGNQRVSDPASGMRVFRRDCLDRLWPLPDGLNFTPVMTARAIHEDVTLRELPINYDLRIGTSKLSVIQDGTLFLKTILWTLLQYNPAGVLGSVGLGALLVAFLLGVAIVASRLAGNTSLGPPGVLAVFLSLVLGVMGSSICCLGLTFDRLVALFHRHPIEGGRWSVLIRRLAFPRFFGIAGALLFLVGLALVTAATLLGLNGWDLPRLWFWLVGSSLFLLVGTQLTISWLLVHSLEVLSERLRPESNFKEELREE